MEQDGNSVYHVDEAHSLVFADDIVLFTQTIYNPCTSEVEALQDEAAKVGRKVNNIKTKEMRVGTPSNAENILCKDQQLERVEAFTYLGNIITTTEGSDEDVEARCKKAQAMFYMLRPVWKSKYISLRTKRSLFNSISKVQKGGG